ncbi:helix-hairpin-helix domain-containing protein [Segetibacter aerophilus]|uniref:DNA polymerase/3'-5' exonuclease PolX n=1 Tax=Segetibacter aerophilus TaxID=670293 RepID=A0A512B9A4_9BACT|nr:helix-hairpin-helix domain-containing protein [Segetibacter aerophilus]GEO08397.1 DNA polymerase/3'-5' exonuclease PolX [Segetibacter aerophilus]
MDNSAIADNFSLLAKLIDIHGDDSFKAKSYSSAAFTIDKLPMQLSGLPEEKMFALKGIGQATGKKILEQLQTGRLSALDEYILKTPAGIFELLKIKGLGPKKIATIWKELGIESMGELLYACEENRLLLYKGFGAKSQQNIQEAIQFLMACKGSYLYSQIEPFAAQFTERLKRDFEGTRFEITGDLKRHAEVIHKLEWVTDAPLEKLETFFKEEEYETNITGEILWAKGAENVTMEFHQTDEKTFVPTLFERNSSPEFFAAWKEKYGLPLDGGLTQEDQLFEKNSLPFIPPFLRETSSILELAENNNLPDVIQPGDIRGIIHTHSDWSDGGDTIEAMAKGAIAKGIEYLVISDHSQSAFYANGLYPNRIKAQHQLIDELNEKYKPFKIFKSIESDILNDGNLDYPEDVLSSFDLVITSVHSNLKMTEEKAMARLLKAISNPYTTILGHMTGRLLLSRNGYPVNHDKIIAACAERNVVIELNAHSRRLDMDWRQIPNALAKGVLISIDPDAHAVDAFEDIKYGVLVAQKAGLTAKNNLSSFTLPEFEAFLEKQRTKRR